MSFDLRNWAVCLTQSVFTFSFVCMSCMVGYMLINIKCLHNINAVPETLNCLKIMLHGDDFSRQLFPLLSEFSVIHTMIQTPQQEVF